MNDDGPAVRNVRLYGKLGARFGRLFRLAVASPAEAVRALSCQLPGFEAEFMTAHDRGYGFAVFIDKRGLREEELGKASAEGDIRIAPVLTGAKNGGWVQIIVGVIIVAAATYISAGALTPAAISATAGAGGIYGAAVMIGVSMVMGGVSQLLAPTPKGLAAKDAAANGASYRFNGPVNTTAQGNPVPLLYGELIIGSAVISAAIVAEDQQ